MAKRKRNSICQFISSTYMGEKAIITRIDFRQTFTIIFMAVFFIFMASPWLTLAIKSKAIKMWLYSIFRFYGDHFIGDDEINGACKCPKPHEDI